MLYKTDKEELIARVKQKPSDYNTFSEEIREDADIALAALIAARKEHGTEHEAIVDVVSARYKDNTSDPFSIELSMIPSSLMSNKAFVLSFFRLCPTRVIDKDMAPLKGLPKTLFEDKEVMMAVLKTYPYLFKSEEHCLDKFRDDDDIVKLVVSNHPSLMRYASNRCQLNRELQADIVAIDPTSYLSVPEEIRDTSFIRDIYERNPSMVITLKDYRLPDKDELLIKKVIKDPQMPKEFYLERLIESNEKLGQIEDDFEYIEGMGVVNCDTGFPINSETLNAKRSLTRMVEHYAGYLSIQDLEECGSKSKTLNDYISKRRIYSISQSEDIDKSKDSHKNRKQFKPT